MTDTPPGGGPQLPQRWGAALGNIADAAVRAETLGDAIDKALWLDEGALEAAAPAAQAAERVNALVRKLLDLKSQLDDARSLAAAAEDARRAAERERDEAREERDNAKSSLAAHVAELVERGEECGRLRGAVEELTKALGGDEDGRGAGGGEASGSDDGGDEHGLPSAPEGDTKARARDAKMARDLASLEAEKLAAEMISAAEEESRGGGGDYFSR